MNKYITDEDIDILIDQGNISREKAKVLLKKHRGDIVACLLELNDVIPKENISSNISDEKEDETIILNQNNIKKYREIVQEKDNIYEELSNKKKERERKKLLIEENIKNNKPIVDLEDKKLTNEDMYNIHMKGNFTSIRII